MVIPEFASEVLLYNVNIFSLALHIQIHLREHACKHSDVHVHVDVYMIHVILPTDYWNAGFAIGDSKLHIAHVAHMRTALQGQMTHAAMQSSLAFSRAFISLIFPAICLLVAFRELWMG